MIQQRWFMVSKRRPASVQEVREILLENRRADGSFFDFGLRDLERCFPMKGIDEGARLVADRIIRGRRIILIGDYDCDGITSVAQMAHFLTDIGYRNFDVVIPNRAEGYGIPARTLTDHPDADLLVAMDCGTFDAEPLAMAHGRGTDSLVIDHHEISDRPLAPATVLINPRQSGCPSVFKDFCSAGLTLLFLTRLRKAVAGVLPQPKLGGKYLAMAAVGTVADMVPLVGGNRILVRHGLRSINDGDETCLKRLAEIGGFSRGRLTAGHLGYYIGPRINAAGRMADPGIAYNFLAGRQPSEVSRLGQELNRLNGKRQKEEARILDEVRGRYTPENAARRTLVMGDASWPAGVIGIVASRIQQEIHHGPVIVFSFDPENNSARGSARSVPGFDIHQALQRCDDLLMRWGGHRAAAGMTVGLDRLDALADRFEGLAREYPAEIFLPHGRVDSELGLGLVSPELLDLLTEVEPCGLGNPTPTFAARNVSVTVDRAFGMDGNHLRLVLDDRVAGIYWRGGPRYSLESWGKTETLDVVFTVEWDDYSGRPVLNVKGLGRFF